MVTKNPCIKCLVQACCSKSSNDSCDNFKNYFKFVSIVRIGFFIISFVTIIILLESLSKIHNLGIQFLVIFSIWCFSIAICKIILEITFYDIFIDVLDITDLQSISLVVLAPVAMVHLILCKIYIKLNKIERFVNN